MPQIILPQALDRERRDHLRTTVLAAIAVASADGRRDLMLDGSAVATCDAVGVSLLPMLEQYAGEVGVQLRIERPSQALRVVLSLAGLDETFGIAA